MHRKLLLFLLFSFFCLQSHSQSIGRERSFIIGTEDAAYYALLNIQSNDRQYIYYNKFAPFISYFPSKDRGYGIMGEYSFISSSFYSRPDLFGVGVLVRQYLPFIRLKNDYLNDFLTFFSEFSYHRTNYYSQKIRNNGDPFGIQVTPSLDIDVLKLHLGTNIKIFKIINFDYCNFLKNFKFLKELRIEISYRPELYINKSLQHTYRLGYEYTFYKK